MAETLFLQTVWVKDRLLGGLLAAPGGILAEAAACELEATRSTQHGSIFGPQMVGSL